MAIEQDIEPQEQVDPAHYAEVFKWVKSSINADYASRRAMPEEDQKNPPRHFNAIPLPQWSAPFLPFEEGMKTFKNAVIQQVQDENFYHGITFFLEKGGFMPKSIEEYARHGDSFADAKPQVKDQINLMLGLVEAQTGFYNLTTEQFHALQILTPKNTFPREYASIENKRPLKTLQQLNFSEFQAIVADVLREKGLPENLPGRDPNKPVTMVRSPLLVESGIQYDNLRNALVQLEEEMKKETDPEIAKAFAKVMTAFKEIKLPSPDAGRGA